MNVEDVKKMIGDRIEELEYLQRDSLTDTSKYKYHVMAVSLEIMLDEIEKQEQREGVE